MVKLKQYERFSDFVEFNRDWIEENTHFYFNLKRNILRVIKGEVPVVKYFNVIENEHLACVLHVGDECLLYANSVTEDMLPVVAKGLEFHRFNKFAFFGTKNIIAALFDTYNVDYVERKYRKYYECSKVSNSFQYSEGELSMGQMEELGTLIEFNQAFTSEFYKGEKESEEAVSDTMNSVLKGTIFQWNLDNQVVASAKVLYDEHFFPVISYVFTHRDYRGRGIAFSLVHQITSGLLERGHEKCLLMTDANNPGSNKAFQKVGYELIGEYVVRFKNK
jgi:predicted GNAT family acetyltransferase